MCLLNGLNQFVFEFFLCFVLWQVQQVEASVSNRQKFVIRSWLEVDLKIELFV